jgi:hypothetical protein
MLSTIWPSSWPLRFQATQLGLNDFLLQQVLPTAFAHGLHKLQLHDCSIQEPPLVLGPTNVQKLF